MIMSEFSAQSITLRQDRIKEQSTAALPFSVCQQLAEMHLEKNKKLLAPNWDTQQRRKAWYFRIVAEILILFSMQSVAHHYVRTLTLREMDLINPVQFVNYHLNQANMSCFPAFVAQASAFSKSSPFYLIFTRGPRPHSFNQCYL